MSKRRENNPMRERYAIVAQMILVVLGAAAFCSALLGGLAALRLKDKLHLTLGFSAGAMIGVAFFDLLPEALEFGGESFGTTTITSVVAFAFIAYLFIDRFIVLHAHSDEEGHGERATLGAGSLSIHSFVDGLGVGFAFQVSAVVGAIVAAAVLTHSFSDGINTVNLVLKNGGSWQQARKWLLIDAIAPPLGIFSTLFFSIPEHMLALILASFCGFFLYVGASDLLPESHHRHPTLWTTVLTAIGIAIVYTAVSIAKL